MLAGALFNRATDIFTSIVELAAKGVETSPDNELMRECEECFVEALRLGKTVKHYSGHEGIDELWGEPLKAFSMSLADCYESRYAKIAQTMRDIDRVADAMVEQIEEDEWLCGARSPGARLRPGRKGRDGDHAHGCGDLRRVARVRRVRRAAARLSSAGIRSRATSGCSGASRTGCACCARARTS